MIAGGNIVCKDKVHLTSLVTRSARSQIIPILVHMVNPELSQEKVQETSEESLAVVAVVDSPKGCGDGCSHDAAVRWIQVGSETGEKLVIRDEEAGKRGQRLDYKTVRDSYQQLSSCLGVTKRREVRAALRRIWI
ncbi:hypothetical protein QQ045_018646 [Rhodiola kirilowii]